MLGVEREGPEWEPLAPTGEGQCARLPGVRQASSSRARLALPGRFRWVPTQQMRWFAQEKGKQAEADVVPTPHEFQTLAARAAADLANRLPEAAPGAEAGPEQLRSGTAHPPPEQSSNQRQEVTRQQVIKAAGWRLHAPEVAAEVETLGLTALEQQMEFQRLPA